MLDVAFFYYQIIIVHLTLIPEQHVGEQRLDYLVDWRSRRNTFINLSLLKLQITCAALTIIAVIKSYFKFI